MDKMGQVDTPQVDKRKMGVEINQVVFSGEFLGNVTSRMHPMRARRCPNLVRGSCLEVLLVLPISEVGYNGSHNEPYK